MNLLLASKRYSISNNQYPGFSIRNANLRTNTTVKTSLYVETLSRIKALLTPDTDWVAAMATVVCELHGAFDYYHWTGFYRTIRPEHLQVGPYQGGHGCIDIPFQNGVCGAAARSGKTQLIEDVDAIADHIACSSTTRSELVVPVTAPSGAVIAVLDVDSDELAAFDEVDKQHLESLCALLGETYGAEAENMINLTSINSG